MATAVAKPNGRTSMRELVRELQQCKDTIDAAYWAFTRQARAKPPYLVCPEAYKRRDELEKEITRRSRR